MDLQNTKQGCLRVGNVWFLRVKNALMITDWCWMREWLSGVDHFFHVGISIDIECGFQASAAMLMRFSLLRNVMYRLVVIYRRFEETFGPILQGQAVRILLGLKMGPISCLETSVSNYESAPRNSQEERRFHWLVFAVDLGNGLRWGKAIVPSWRPAADVFQLKIRWTEL